MRTLWLVRQWSKSPTSTGEPHLLSVISSLSSCGSSLAYMFSWGQHGKHTDIVNLDENCEWWRISETKNLQDLRLSGPGMMPTETLEESCSGWTTQPLVLRSCIGTSCLTHHWHFETPGLPACDGSPVHPISVFSWYYMALLYIVQYYTIIVNITLLQIEYGYIVQYYKSQYNSIIFNLFTNATEPDWTPRAAFFVSLPCPHWAQSYTLLYTCQIEILEKKVADVPRLPKCPLQ